MKNRKEAVNGILKKYKVILVALLASVCSASILYELYYTFSNFIWSLNSKVAPEELSPLVRPWLVEHDGVETYVLYILLFTSILLAVLLAGFCDYLMSRFNKRATVFVLVSLFASSWFFFSNVGFHPPVESRMMEQSLGMVFAGVFICVLWVLLKIASKYERFVDLLLVGALIPVCFIATSGISLFDYSFIFAPALRIMNGFEISEVYFQYDILLSFLAALWMKLHMDLNSFQILGQLSYYSLFLFAFFFSKKFFLEKKLAYYLLAALILVKTYALICDPILVFQVTPLRLDWWIILLAISFTYGIYSKRLGIALGMLLVFHRTFGFIYLIGYIEMMLLLFAFDFFGGKPSMRYLVSTLKKHFRLCLPNMIVTAISIGASYFLLGGISTEAASAYQKIGIGFIQIARISFYWYFVVLLGAAVIILMRRKKFLTDRYYNGALFLFVLSIGSSVYFFGRSHENNIINVAAPLIFVLFLFFDLVILSASINGMAHSRWKRILPALLPSSFIVLVAFFYSARIHDRTNIQIDNLLKNHMTYPKPSESTWNITTIKKLTSNSDKVYFMGADDFYYYYYGKYVPIDRHFPYASWVYKKDMVSFMQGILNEGYFIVSPQFGQGLYPDPQADDEILSELVFDRVIVRNGFKVVWNEGK